MGYRLFIKELDEVKGHRVGDYQHIEEARQDAKELMEGLPEGTQGYVYRQSVDEEGKGWGPIRPAEAYEIRGGEVVRIWSRWVGGQWPRVWSTKMGAGPSERLRVKELFEKFEVKEDRETLSKFEGPDWEASKKEFLEEGPRTYFLPGEHRYR